MHRQTCMASRKLHDTTWCNLLPLQLQLVSITIRSRCRGRSRTFEHIAAAAYHQHLANPNSTSISITPGSLAPREPQRYQDVVTTALPASR
ncbi:hypothetical protein PoB_001315000 [Plakobranchus ocellatus]|uniref:Uncharacterized protein n=1 Tax=Plakobranchus ocellatus TaxID=259542 RepID=A0AAV3YTX7_9GAST|nr:hypothetical protein PoB_001315000 [Plakobranchus ocellatus]